MFEFVNDIDKFNSIEINIKYFELRCTRIRTAMFLIVTTGKGEDLKSFMIQV